MSDWIQWSGQFRPVHESRRVDYILGNGREFSGKLAGGLYWGSLGGEYDIVAYRLSKEQDGGRVEF